MVLIVLEILITGTDGFIGNYLKQYLKSNGSEVFGTVFIREPLENEVKFDIRKTEEFDKLPKRQFEVIIHTIGLIDQTAPKKRLFEINAEGTKKMLDWAMKNGCQHFIQLSSISVYGFKTMGENRTEDRTKRSQGRLMVPYGPSKAKAEIYIEESGLNYSILRLPSVLGEKDTFISPSIIPRLKNGTFFFSGKKNDKLFSTLYVKNLGPIIKKLINVGPLNNAFNCTDYQITWYEFVEEFAKNLNIELIPRKKSFLTLLTHLKDKNYLYLLTNSYYGAHFPNDKLKEKIGFEPEYPWQEGVKEAINGYLLQTNGKKI